MAKTAKGTKKRIGRPEGRKPLINLRIEQELLDRLKAAAARHPGRTIAEETVTRIRRTFREDEVIGGPEIRELTHAMTAIFAFVAKRTAIAAEHPEWTAKEWLADQDCYQSATIEVCRALILGMPTPSHEVFTETLDTLKRFLDIELKRRGENITASGFFNPKGGANGNS